MVRTLLLIVCRTKRAALFEMCRHWLTVHALYASFCNGRPQMNQTWAAACLSQTMCEASKRGLH